jgi:hypothetical protein
MFFNFHVFHVCEMTVLSVDAMDVSGEQHIDVDHNIFKQRLDSNGGVVPSLPEKEGYCIMYYLIKVLNCRLD